jgi:lipid-binding SYLF domain-containing protein
MARLGAYGENAEDARGAPFPASKPRRNMMRTAVWICAALSAFAFSFAAPAAANDAATLSKDSLAALNDLYAKTPAAKALGEKAKAILVFPKVTRAGLVVGGAHGEGALIKDGKVQGFFSTTMGSVGLQAGVQHYSYAMFFMSDKIVEEFKTSKGFEVGVGPTVVVVDEGAAAQLTQATIQSDIYAFVFGQKGLMAGVGVQGSKISRIEKQ